MATETTLACQRVLAVSFTLGACGCSWLNRVDVVCEEVPVSERVDLDDEPSAWIASRRPSAVLPSGPVAVGYLAGGPDPFAPETSELRVAVLSPRDASVMLSCGVPSEPADGRRAATPSVVASDDDAQPGAIAHRASAEGEPDEIRLSFLGSDGCPATNEVGEPFATIAVADSSRYLLSPQLAFLRAGQFAAVWFSSDVNVEMFDDRLEARLLHPEWPHFLPNYASPSGDPVTLDVQDRWIVSPALTAIDVPESSERRLALIWYAKESQSGSVKLALFDERLERVSDDSVLDTDRDQGSALQDKVIAITYDRSQHALFAMWSKVQGGKSTIVGRRVNVWPEIEPRNWFDVTSPEDAPAYTPSVAVLPDDQVVVAWKSGSGLSAAIFRPNGERRFTNYACGGEAFDALVPSSGQVFEPTAFRVDQQLVVLGTVRRTTGPDATSLVRRVVMPIEEIFPDCE